MNFEEMLNAKEASASHREKVPWGDFYRKQVEGKYRYAVALRRDLTDSIVFCEALKKEQQWSLRQRARQQLHYNLLLEDGELREMDLEAGNFQTIADLLNQNPAVVAVKGFVDKVVEALFEYTAKLHEERVFHLCFAPQTVFVRKGDASPLLLIHGSFYQGMERLADVFQGCEDYLAPEVLEGKPVDARSDVYALGKFIAYLFDQGALPFEYRKVVRKATDPRPEKRYKSVEDMRSALSQRRNMRRSAIMMVVALVISLLAVYVYFDMMPATEAIEFVEPVKTETVDPLEELYDDPMEADTLDTTDSLDMVDMPTDAQLQEKLEEIYRRRFRQAADELLSKVYEKKYMGASEKSVMAGTQSMGEELVKLQQQMATETGLSGDVAERIGREIVEALALEKQQGLKRKGYVRRGQNEESDN